VFGIPDETLALVFDILLENSFVSRKISKNKEFGDFPDRKKAFLDYENKMLKKWKNRHFSKGVGPWL